VVWGGRGAGWTISGKRHFRITGNLRQSSGIWGWGLGLGMRFLGWSRFRLGVRSGEFGVGLGAG
jgi:hypothetical protein